MGSALVGAIGLFVFGSINVGRLFAVPWQIYSLIGIWGSADNYKGLKLFAILAKVFVVIWMINNIGKLKWGYRYRNHGHYCNKTPIEKIDIL